MSLVYTLFYSMLIKNLTRGRLLPNLKEYPTMLKVQVQLPFGETLPTQSDLGWNAGTPTVHASKPCHTPHIEEVDLYNPDDPDNEGQEFGWQIG